MLVCNVSVRQRRTVAADIVEVAGAAIDALGLTAFALIVDESAAARDTLDAFSGSIIREAATAADVVSAGVRYVAAVVEEASARATQSEGAAPVLPSIFTTTRTHLLVPAAAAEVHYTVIKAEVTD